MSLPDFGVAAAAASPIAVQRGSNMGHVAPEPESFPLRSGSDKRAKTILLVDDEPLVRNVEQHMLHAAGVQRRHGLEWRGRHTDIQPHRAGNRSRHPGLHHAPALNGRDTWEHLRAMDPQVSVIFCSGNCTRQEANALMAEGAKGLHPQAVPHLRFRATHPADPRRLAGKACAARTKKRGRAFGSSPFPVLGRIRVLAESFPVRQFPRCAPDEHCSVLRSRYDGLPLCGNRCRSAVMPPEHPRSFAGLHVPDLQRLVPRSCYDPSVGRREAFHRSAIPVEHSGFLASVQTTDLRESRPTIRRPPGGQRWRRRRHLPSARQAF